eukprot:TRINITY_DN129_c0_g1_i1.p1 TRINITY_DN129_c0_g1~~TRINITY_DN129_c0_g1_i1.p1  ORF type:complete len:807 (-),score=106.47 TRINITY_DN129_c0_g1_i1:44-2464(-)
MRIMERGIFVALAFLGVIGYAHTASLVSWTNSDLFTIPVLDDGPTGGTGANFGDSMASVGRMLVIGASGLSIETAEGEFFSQAGSVFVYQSNGGNLTLMGQISSSDAESSAYFGSSVAAYDQTIVIGAEGTNKSDGRAYIYSGGNGNFTRTHSLNPPVPSSGRFGVASAIEGDFICIGAPYNLAYREENRTEEAAGGGIYIFSRNAAGLTNSWGLLQSFQLAPGQANPVTHQLGACVAISLPYLVAGAPGYYPSGAVFVYRLDAAAGRFVHSQLLLQPNTTRVPLNLVSTQFGTAVACDGATLVVGAPASTAAYFDGTRVIRFAGEVRVYALSSSTGQWEHVAELAPCEICNTDTCNDQDQFGSALAVSGDTIVVGSPNEASRRGGIYVFSRHQNGVNGWGMVTHLLQPSAMRHNFFGETVALMADSWVMASAVGTNEYSAATGSYYLAVGEVVGYVKPCATNYYMNVTAGACIACPQSQYDVDNDTDIIARCFPCPARMGLFNAVQFCNQTSCVDCPLGYYCPVGQQPVACPQGTFNNQTLQLSVAACRACSNGTYTATAGASMCAVCPAGGYCVAGMFRPCPARSYSNVTGAQVPDVCVACALGTYSPPGAALCLEMYNPLVLGLCVAAGGVVCMILLLCLICRYRRYMHEREEKQPLIFRTPQSPLVRVVPEPTDPKRQAWLLDGDTNATTEAGTGANVMGPSAETEPSAEVIVPHTTVDDTATIAQKEVDVETEAVADTTVAPDLMTVPLEIEQPAVVPKASVFAKLPVLASRRSTLPPLQVVAKPPLAAISQPQEDKTSVS